MADKGFPKPVEDVIATLAGIYRHQSKPEMVELIESASARIEDVGYDNWNGGTYTYKLVLDVPVSIFAKIEPNLKAFESDISAKSATICRNFENDHLDSTVITPLASKSTSVALRPKPADAEVAHIWKDGLFRLFLSHVSAQKVAVVQLKNELLDCGISAFVAHEDIIPSLEWQNEIELALRSMHALAALITPDFHASHWTNQEVGFALGKGVVVVPIRLGADPCGFVAKVQGLSGTLEQPSRLASLLCNTLLNHPTTHREMRKALVAAFAVAKSFINSISLSKLIVTVNDFTTEDKDSLLHTCKENDQVYKATGVVARVCAAIGVPMPTKFTTAPEFPF